MVIIVWGIIQKILTTNFTVKTEVWKRSKRMELKTKTPRMRKTKWSQGSKKK
jgi:hypothetical protein